MDRNIYTKKDAANKQLKQEAEILGRWVQVLRGDLNNSQGRLGDALTLTKNDLDAEYWRGCIDTALHFIAMMETTIARGENG